MLKLRRHTAWPTWIALLAIWALSLVPTVSQLLAAAAPDGSVRAEICTPQGLRWVTLVAVDELADGPAGTPADTLAAAHSDHCPLCRLQHDAPPLPLATALSHEPAPGPAFVPSLFLQAPHTLHAWRSAQPRGPPLLS
jgi:hypothetical protein